MHNLSLTLEPSGELRLRLNANRVTTKRGLNNASGVARCQDGTLSSIATKSENFPECPAGQGRMPPDTSFTSRARRSVKNACGALKSKFGSRLVFATLTLPGSTDEARAAVAIWSSRVVNLLTHWIRYTAPHSMYVFVWERQRSGALHLHAAIGSPSVLELRALERGFRKYVHTLFKTVSALAGVDMFQRADGGTWKGNVTVLRSNCVPVRKCIKRYMSKYISKGSGERQGHSPARWYGISALLRFLIRHYRRCLHIPTRDLYEVAEQLRDSRAWLRSLGVTIFEWSEPYRPHNRTIVAFPKDDDAQVVYNALAMRIENCYRSIEDQCCFVAACSTRHLFGVLEN